MRIWEDPCFIPGTTQSYPQQPWDWAYNGYGYPTPTVIGTWRYYSFWHPSHYAKKYIPSTQEGYYGVRFITTASFVPITLSQNGTVIVKVAFNANGTISLQRIAGSGGTYTLTTVAVATERWISNRAYHIELHAKLVNGGTGLLEVRLDGNRTILSYSGANVADLASAAFNEYQYSTAEGAGYVTHITINDTTGSYDNAWAGPCKSFRRQVTGNGSLNEWSKNPDSGANWEKVDDNTADALDTDYVSANASGKIDEYVCGTADYGLLVPRAVSVWSLGKKEDGRQFQHGISCNGTRYFSATKELGVDWTWLWERFPRRPDTTGAWDATQANNLKPVIKAI